MFHPDLLQFGVTADCRKIGPSALGASATPSPLLPQIGMLFDPQNPDAMWQRLACTPMESVLAMVVFQLEEQRSR